MSDDGFVVTPASVAALAAEVLEGAGTLAAAGATAAVDAGPPSSAFGNLTASSRAAISARTAVDRAGAAVEALVTVLEDDADRLVAVASNYAEVEERTRETIGRIGTGLGPR